MYSDLKDYSPKEIEFCLDEAVKEKFPEVLDFSIFKCKGVSDIIKLVSKEFCATFPDNENVDRKMDEFEKTNIREEYCYLVEKVLPERKKKLQETLEEIKLMKKNAEDMLASTEMEIDKYASEVNRGTQEIRLKSTETFCVAVGGHYLIYTYDKNKNAMVLAKAFEVPDRTEIWSTEDKNREAFRKFFGIDFPEPEKPTDDEDPEYNDEMPFGDNVE